MEVIAWWNSLTEDVQGGIVAGLMLLTLIMPSVIYALWSGRRRR